MTYKEAYCSFEVAKLLNEKGFEAYTHMVYKLPCQLFHTDKERLVRNNNDITKGGCTEILAPTHQMAMRWLRETFKLEIYPFHDAIQENNNWWYRIEYHQKGCSIPKYESEPIFFSYEEAVEAALKYSLEKYVKEAEK